MQTTLRIDDKIYREAKSQAAREGLTLTRFLEEGIQLRLKQTNPRDEESVDWLLRCPSKGYFVSVESESTDSL